MEQQFPELAAFPVSDPALGSCHTHQAAHLYLKLQLQGTWPPVMASLETCTYITSAHRYVQVYINKNKYLRNYVQDNLWTEFYIA